MPCWQKKSHGRKICKEGIGKIGAEMEDAINKKAPIALLLLLPPLVCSRQFFFSV
jgi:hypothetical protein